MIVKMIIVIMTIIFHQEIIPIGILSGQILKKIVLILNKGTILMNIKILDGQILKKATVLILDNFM
ncbi:hypothetical protein GLOIN_2v1607024 [Rhizophagus irregularis DAOM 181602=DAOM 197198]|uniref:Uncharacterized protein n=1 Tax=Rhizophagus irregularis (strain DAOM 181602 / DAOM 197198 / MUCL 43194) TaxID=747089 RepID=A0A2P4Q143_RHIID|nr:hypothetical protein GLOIN_2v1607024 [Rhizophagus irregularis DAOM 181602=DAOM 197198]POG71344.1 hypothetical protein GLOIN_2v1607024 [Rhizophagus irregularis DAOM 181602=DAOM 197198]|eukprot:XP_025178210.1 hypothetical protein GLOIN_2v1607024 [Rhizophagus irregularis DAOM 181602=DAOM 197198]